MGGEADAGNGHCHFGIETILGAQAGYFSSLALRENENSMNLSQLRYAKAVAETGSFTLAADRCYVTQPTLSNGISQLENELEERLFKRTTRSVSLTPFGEHIMPFIDKVLAANDELVRETRGYVHPAHTSIRIGMSPLVDAEWLSPLLEKYREMCSEVEIILHEQNMVDLYRMLDEGLLDFIFVVAETRKPSWGNAFLYREPLYYIPCGVSRPEPENGTVPFEAVAEETFVMVPNACGLASSTRSLFRSHRRKLNEYSGEALSYQVLEQWAALGLGAAILPKSKLSASKRKAYALTGKNGQELMLEFEALWLTSSPQPEHLRRFRDFLENNREDS